MKIETLEGIANCIVFNGKIKNNENFLELKNALKQILKKHQKENPFCFFLHQNTHPLDFCLIGYFLKLKENDGWNIKLHTNDIRILKSFEDLKLHKKFEMVLRDL